MDKKRDLVMGKLYFKNKDYRMAEKSLNEYLTNHPEDAEALKLLAQVYEQIRRYDKAFEIYERCYLAEPSRTGVLLDICRILLMNEVWLEHVDYRKWLKLAISNFPSSPIVTDFRAFLATIPQTNQSSPQREIQPSVSIPRPSGMDEFSKILEKLSSIEGRIAGIEKKISALSIATVPEPVSAPAPVQVAPARIPAPTPTPSPATTTNHFGSFTTAAAPSLFSTTTAAPTLFSKTTAAPALFSTTTTTAAPALFSKTTAAPTLFSKTTAAPTLFSSTTAAPTPFSATTPAPTLSTSPTPTNATSPTATRAFSLATTKASSPITTTDTTPATTTNLFAASMAKFNIPSGGFQWNTSFSSTFGSERPKDQENEGRGGEGGAEGGEEEVVQNEELPIENTCDMTPIEIKSGEENENLLFEQRCKLYRFKDKEYKERGLGSIKVLEHKETGKGRLIMRREAIGLVCLNCWDCSKVERVKETQVRWMGIDASDGEPEATVFLVRFKTQELTDEFMSHLLALFSDESPSRNTSISIPQSKSEDTEGGSKNEKPEIELVDPQLDQSLVDKARQLKLPDLFFHEKIIRDRHSGSNCCDDDDNDDDE